MGRPSHHTTGTRAIIRRELEFSISPLEVDRLWKEGHGLPLLVLVARALCCIYMNCWNMLVHRSVPGAPGSAEWRHSAFHQYSLTHLWRKALISKCYESEVRISSQVCERGNRSFFFVKILIFFRRSYDDKLSGSSLYRRATKPFWLIFR